MAGHSKWANIQHRKKAQDAKRAKVFTRLIREITVAARLDGGDLNANPRLRLAVDKANCANMPKNVIDRAIKRGSGEGGAENLETVLYEAYGPGGSAVMVECVTDNRNRTAAEVRFAFSKHGGNLGEPGSVAYMFDKVGVIRFPDVNHDELFELALELEATDVMTDADEIMVTVEPKDLQTMKDQFVERGFQPAAFAVELRPQVTVTLNEDQAEQLERLLDAIDQLEDVQDVVCNAEVAGSQAE